MSFVYLGLLLISLAGLATLDIRFKLAFAKNPKAAALATGVPYLIFVIWDLCGIASGIFFKGQSNLLTGLMIAKDFPVEELFFLALLCYTTLIVASGLDRVKK